MPRKNSYLTVTDQFCGAGGSSQGVRRFAERAGLGSGVEVRLALNHWKLAIETHQTNFPDAAHECTDIQACDPRRYPSTDILITSPECTNHSVAKGRKAVKAQMDAFDTGAQDAAAERSRATMWDVVRFAEHHQYRIIITENVVDARAWVLWDAWITAMHSLGYHHQCVFFNSMFAFPTPQSRDRMYVVFWRKGQRKPNLDIRPKAPCMKCGIVEAVQRFKPGSNVKAKYGRQYTYACPTCGTDTMPFYFAAINAIDWTLPAERIGDRKTPLKERTMARIEYGLKKYGSRPLTLTNYFSSGVDCRVKDATDAPLFTQHSKAGTAVVSPYMLNMRGTSEGRIPHSTEGMAEPMGTHTGAVHHALVSPFQVGTEYDDTTRTRGMDEPMAAQTGRASAGIAMPFVMDSSFTKANGEYMNAGDEPMATQTTTQSKGVVIPPALMVDTNYFTDHVRPMDGVMPSQTGANKLALATAFIVKQRGTDDGHVKASAIGMDEALGTLSAGGNHHALVNGKAMGFIHSAYSGVHNVGPLDGPVGTMSCTDRHALVTGERPAITVEDLYFRMLKAHEVKAGMAFAPDYIVLGNQREQVKQLGNAVTPPVMEILVERCIQSLM